jgi:hypothetical protein
VVGKFDLALKGRGFSRAATAVVGKFHFALIGRGFSRAATAIKSWGL